MTVGLALEQRRSSARAGPLHGLERRLAHRPHIVAVDDARRDPEHPGARRDVLAGGDRRHRRELAVEVVLAHEHRGQRKHLGEVHALVEVALVGRPVAEHRHRNPALALGRERRPGGGGDTPADDPEAAHEAVLDVDHVHRPGAAAAHAGGAAEHLGDQRVGVGALGERVPVAAIRAGEPVAGLERRAHADRHGLLAGAQVGGAVDLALEEQALHLGLEPADQQHPPVAVEVGRRGLGVDRGVDRHAARPSPSDTGAASDSSSSPDAFAC